MFKMKNTFPFAPFEWMLATRYLRARRKEGFISVIAGFSFVGITLGVATLIIVMAVMNGFRNQLLDKILGLNGHAIVHKAIGSDPFNKYEEISTKLELINGIKHAIPLIEGQVLFSGPRQARGGFVRGITEKGMRSLPLISRKIISGEIHNFDDQRGIAVGVRLANDLGVSLGDVITIISPRGSSTPFGNVPRTKPYRIKAIFELGMSEYDRTMVFMPMAEAQRYFSKKSRIDLIEVITENPDNINEYIIAMKNTLGKNYGFVSWKDRNRVFFTVLEVERTVMFIILSLIILVAALNIISGIMMLVKDKSRDIAILRTMGATKHAIMRIFLITGASIGVVGTISGLILGITFCLNIDYIRQLIQKMTGTTLMDPNVYYLTQLPAEINIHETITIVMMALTLSVLATLYPSWRASKLDPIEALRYE
ncbi:MAG: Lipoprotein-releasing system transmembrane protein LolC [Hyphomicrobiaceae bacterium hypho_1]